LPWTYVQVDRVVAVDGPCDDPLRVHEGRKSCVAVPFVFQDPVDLFREGVLVAVFASVMLGSMRTAARDFRYS